MAKATPTLGYRIQPDDRYWAIARQKGHQKTGETRWEPFCWFGTLTQAAQYLLHLTAAGVAEEPYDLAALLKSVSLAESHVLAAVAQVSVSYSAPRGSALDAPAPIPN